MKITKLTNPNPKLGMFRFVNVVAYCRVSTQQEQQHHSLEAQYEYYEQYIKHHLNWKFAGIYTDQASGRYHKKMRNFQVMLNDCRAGKIDLILVKSISRFGRNTLEFLDAINLLNSMGVDVYFEVEKLHSSDPTAMKMLTIFASLYQQESESKSYAIRWGLQACFADGFSKMYCRPCYGYENVNGLLQIVPDQAAVVVRIFEYRQAGVSLRKISSILEKEKIPAPHGGGRWNIETIRKILANEKYHGTVILGKTYVSDYFTGRQSPNRGEQNKYVYEKHHEPII